MALSSFDQPPKALITGGAKRIGRAIVSLLHQQGYQVIVHCHGSKVEAERLVDELEAKRPGFAQALSADLSNQNQLEAFCKQVLNNCDRLDLLVNNASVFSPNRLGETLSAHWDEQMTINAKAPFFLIQGLLPALTKARGSVINLIDTHAFNVLPKHSVYCASKAALTMLTRVLAVDLAPKVRVNGIAPGAILGPADGALSQEQVEALAAKTVPLRRCGSPKEIADAVLFLAQSEYITGQVLAVDGGRMLSAMPDTSA